MEIYQNLQANKQEVKKNRERLDDPDEILGYVGFFLITIENFSNEIERLSIELKSSVKKQHVISFEQLYGACINIDKHYCKSFKREHISRKLKDEELRYLVDMICADTGNLMYSFRSFGGIRRRLEALVGTKYVPYGKSDKINIKPEEKLRPNQKAKIESRKAAKRLWNENPQLTIAAAINHPDIIKVTIKSNGNYYLENTVRNWIKDLCPNRSAGRRKKQKS